MDKKLKLNTRMWIKALTAFTSMNPILIISKNIHRNIDQKVKVTLSIFSFQKTDTDLLGIEKLKN